MGDDLAEPAHSEHGQVIVRGLGFSDVSLERVVPGNLVSSVSEILVLDDWSNKTGQSRCGEEEIVRRRSLSKPAARKASCATLAVLISAIPSPT